MHKVFTYLIVCLLLVGCSSITNEPAPSVTSAPTALPTSTATAIPEPTPTLTPIEGLLFFDMNGSGLRDEASFNYDAARLTDERQPLQADLLKALTDYIASRPDLKDGDLVTIEEPGLSGYTVCAKSNCVTTDVEGRFQLVEPDVDRFLNITLKDPNAGTPALEMMYVNKWKREVMVPAYEMNGIQVPEQHLNDTLIFKLSDGATLQPGNPNEIGLIQGLFNRPYCVTHENPEIIFNGFDIDGIELWRENGSVMNYLGDTTPASKELNPGTNDSHQAVDYSLPRGTVIYAPAEGKINHVNEDNGINIMISYLSDTLRTSFGHVDNRIIINNGNFSSEIRPIQDVYRGQVITLSSDTGDTRSYWFGQRIPLLHFGMYIVMPGNPMGDPSTDFYRNVSGVQSKLASQLSYWTVDNLPINLYICK